MYNKITLIIGGVTAGAALVLAPLAAAAGSGHSPAGGAYRQPVVPAMQFGTTIAPATPVFAEPTPFAKPATKAKH